MAHKRLKWLIHLASRRGNETTTSISSYPHNNSLKPTVTRVTHFAEKAKPAPRYGGLVPPVLRAIIGDGNS